MVPHGFRSTFGGLRRHRHPMLGETALRDVLPSGEDPSVVSDSHFGEDHTDGKGSRACRQGEA